MKFVPHTVHDDEKLRMQRFCGNSWWWTRFSEYHYYWMRVLAFLVRSRDAKIRVWNSKSHISQRPKKVHFHKFCIKNMLIIHSSIPMEWSIRNSCQNKNSQQWVWSGGSITLFSTLVTYVWLWTCWHSRKYKYIYPKLGCTAQSPFPYSTDMAPPDFFHFPTVIKM